MIQVESTVRVYELDGKDIEDVEELHVLVRSHLINNGRIIVAVKSASGERSFTVSAADLISAINNATNTNRYGR